MIKGSRPAGWGKSPSAPLRRPGDGAFSLIQLTRSAAGACPRRAGKRRDHLDRVQSGGALGAHRAGLPRQVQGDRAPPRAARPHPWQPARSGGFCAARRTASRAQVAEPAETGQATCGAFDESASAVLKLRQGGHHERRQGRSHRTRGARHCAGRSHSCRQGRTRGPLLGLPELPGDDYWLDMAGATALTGIPPKTITSWLARGGPVRNPFPVPQRLLYRLYWRGTEIASWQTREKAAAGQRAAARSGAPPAEGGPTAAVAAWRAVRPYATRPLARPRTGWHVVARQLSGGPPRARGHALCLATECPCEFPQYPGIDTRRPDAVFSHTSLSRPHCLGGVERITTLIEALRCKPAASAPLTDRFGPHADHLASLGGREESVTTRRDQRSHPRRRARSPTPVRSRSRV